MALTLVDPACFPGLSPLEKRAQLYLAAYTAAGDDTLTYPECFMGLSQQEQETALYAALYTLT